MAYCNWYNRIFRTYKWMMLMMMMMATMLIIIHFHWCCSQLSERNNKKKLYYLCLMVIVRMKFFDHNQMELIFRSDLCVCVYGSVIVFRQIWKLKFFFAFSKINFGSAIGEFLMMMMNRREGEKILCYYQKKSLQIQRMYK